MKKLRVVFAGTPEFGLPSLEALCEHHEVIAVYTQPDRPQGRGQKLMPSPIKAYAEARGIAVHQPAHFKDASAVETLRALAPDVMVVIAYGLILPQRVLDIPAFGCINVHASLLPRHRGAAPIQYALLCEDEETGVSIMQMDKGMDTGPQYLQKAIAIEPTDTAKSLHDKLAPLAVRPLLDTLAQLGHIEAVAQDDTRATYAGKIDKAMAKIDWQAPASQIVAKIRAFNPWPIAYTCFDNETVKIHQAYRVSFASTVAGKILSLNRDGLLISAGQDAVCVTHLQFPGGRAMPVSDWLNAPKHRPAVGEVLS